MIHRILSAVALLVPLALAMPLAHAQSPNAAQANSEAYTLFSGGNYAAAAAAYEKVLKDYPTDAVVPAAQIQLAFSYFFLGKFDDALAMAQKALTGPPLPDELKQVVEALLPQILANNAASLPANDAKRRTTFEQAIAKYTEYIGKYPQAQDLESVIYGRGVANYQIAKFDETVKDMELNIQKFPNSPTLATSRNLLAIALATQGSAILNDKGDRAQAFALYGKAADLLRQIISNKKDLALYNEANFQLAEILFNQAAFSDEADRPALYANALAAYRAIVPKDEIVALQQDVVAAFPEKRREAIQRRDQAALKQLERENLRQLAKLEEIKNKPDQVATAMQKMGEIYFQQNLHNAARTVLRHVAPFLQNPEDIKRNAYFQTMSYAMQGNAERALAGYREFQGKHKGDPIADNLPLTMGTMLLGQNRAEESLTYFDESLTLYPQGRFTGLTVVTKASAEARLGRHESAVKTFREFLEKNPPPEVGVVAQAGLAGVFRDTAKWDDAIAAFSVLKDKYPGTPQAVEAEYWIGIATQQKGDNAGAIPKLDAFVKAHPGHTYASLALYAKGGAQLATNDKEGGVATLAEVAEKYPDSPAAPITYFLRAQHAGAAGRTDEVAGLMKAFIERYPKDDKVFAAYDNLAGMETAAGKVDGAVVLYREYAQKYEQAPQAAQALQKAADLQRGAAEALGRYGALNDDERAKWKTQMDASVTTIEELLKKYPESPQIPFALRTLLANQRLLVSADLRKSEEVQTYFTNLSEEAPSPKTKSIILFVLADYVGEADPARALEIMTKAYDPAVVYAPADLDTYGTAVLAQNRTDEAAGVFEKLAKDYPIPAGTAPTQAAPAIQEAQAMALLGQGKVLQAGGQDDEAGKTFQQLKSLYPWWPKVFEADYGIAQSLRKQGKLDEAVALLGGVIRANNATAELRANSMLLFGYIMGDKQKAASDPKEKDQFQGAAIDNFIKIAQFYAGVPKAAAEGLWMGAQLLEQQAGASTDAKFKTQQLNRAKTFYTQLTEEFPNSEFVPKAKERLAALGTS
jgi:tetratricopeptide (TPR) repeat protein